MKIYLAALLLLPAMMIGQIPKVTSGKIEHFENFKSAFVEARNIDVWLPDDYSDKYKYAVVYMHDGQMLFDREITWNKQSWEADETAGKMNEKAQTKRFIIVGIWSNGMKRHFEYFPQKVYKKLSDEEKDFVSQTLQKTGRIKETFNPYSDHYLKFIVSELKPFIDTHFSTLRDKDNTYIAGSSMGGLISLYAICEYPKIFGAAACISTHWTGIFALENNPVPDKIFEYLRNNLPNPRDNRIYFDYGDQTLDALYPSLQQKVNLIMYEKGFDAINWNTKSFPGKDHSEKAWAERLHIPLEFLLQQ